MKEQNHCATKPKFGQAMQDDTMANGVKCCWGVQKDQMSLAMVIYQSNYNCLCSKIWPEARMEGVEMVLYI